MKYCRLLLAAVGATVVLGALSSTASARTLSSSSSRIYAAFESVRFRTPEAIVECVVTLEGSLHSRTIDKIVERLIGYITSAVLGTCVTGTATILRETLPWHVRYASFTGTLPNISRLVTHVIGSAFQIRGPGVFEPACLARSTATEPAIGTYEREVRTGELTGVEISGTIRTTCFGIAGSFTSSRPVPTAGANGARITVTLI
jgi:hypothetical protein